MVVPTAKRRASPEKVDVQADPTAESGKADTVGWGERDYAQPLHRGTGGGMYTRKAHATREASMRDQGWSTGRPRGTGRAHWGGGEARSVRWAAHESGGL